MPLGLYDMLVPAFDRGLAALWHLLDAGELLAREQEIETADLLDARLIDDMDPLLVQVQRACEIAQGSVVTLGAVEPLAMPDEEETFSRLQRRIERTRAFLDLVPRDALDAGEANPVSIDFPGGAFHFDGMSFAQKFALPNFYFHVTTAYAILRMRGAAIGKLDYLGRDLLTGDDAT